MLPERIIPAKVERGVIVPLFLTAADHPWLGVLMDEIDRFRGRPFRELKERLRAPLPCAAPFIKSRAATVVMLRLWPAVQNAPVSPPVAREAAFVAAASAEFVKAKDSRAAALAEAGVRTNASATDIERSLFADLPDERLVQAPEEIPSVPDAALRVNLAIARSLMFRASVVHIHCEGAIRPVVRQAHLRGLLCTVRAAAPEEIEISGPYAIFRRTLLYGRALGELIPFLARTARFQLKATCSIHATEGELRLGSGDPIFPASTPKAFDSKLEERFAKDFKRSAPDWDLLREPQAVPAGGTLIFPDFLLRHRLDPARQALLEIVGFWTPEYLAHKFASLRAARIDNLILAVDKDRQCAPGDLPAGARVIWYRKRIDPKDVLAILGVAINMSR